MSKILSSFLVLLLTVNPCFARAVSLDVKHTPSSKQFWENRGYFVNIRKRIQSNWKDPLVGCTVKVRFIVDIDGKLYDILPVIHQEEPSTSERIALATAARAIYDASPFEKLPENQEAVEIVAEFKSEHPSEPVSTDKLATALAVLGITAIAGFTIWALIKNSKSPDDSSYPNENGCIGSANCHRCKNCNACMHCNSGRAPCNIWYLYH